MGYGISFWKGRQSNMTSVSSDVTMTAFEPVLAACGAYKSKRVSGSSCVDCSSATSTHLSAVILKQIFSQVTYNASPCSIYLYRCSFHSPTKKLMRLVVLKELHRNCLHCCIFVPLQAFVLKGFAFTIKYSERLNWGACKHLSLAFQNVWWTAGGMRQRQHQPYHSVHPHTVPWTRQTLPVVQMFCFCGSSFVPVPSINDGVWIASAGYTFFSSSVASAALFVFRRDPSAFASAHGSGPSGWAMTSFMFTLLLSATRISWLNGFYMPPEPHFGLSFGMSLCW